MARVTHKGIFMKTNVFCIITYCCLVNMLMLSAGCKHFAKEQESLQTEKLQITVIDKYDVRNLSVADALKKLAHLCGEKSGRSFSVILNNAEYKTPLITLNCVSMTVKDIIKLISEQSGVFIEFGPMVLIVDCSRDSQGEKRK